MFIFEICLFQRHGAFVYPQIPENSPIAQSLSNMSCAAPNTNNNKQQTPESGRSRTSSINFTQNATSSSPPAVRRASMASNNSKTSAHGKNGKTSSKTSSPKMMETSSSPIEWYIPPGESPPKGLLNTVSSPVDVLNPDEK
jgi:hypothetical protein